jgi:hypothetical protein
MKPRVTAVVMSAGTLAAWLAVTASAWRMIAEAALPCLGMLVLVAWTISDADRTRRLCALICAFRSRDQPVPPDTSGSRQGSIPKRSARRSPQSAAPHAGPAAEHPPGA